MLKSGLARRLRAIDPERADRKRDLAARAVHRERSAMAREDARSAASAQARIAAAQRHDRFMAAREALRARMLDGFSPAQSHGRKLYFARTGLTRRANRLCATAP